MRNKAANFSKLIFNFLKNLFGYYNGAMLEICYMKSPVTEIEVMT